MYFDDKYFKTEEIDGFVVDSMMKRAWAAEMEIMQEIDRICKENDLQYYAAWGTLLGTIRHKGFIPWDDDIDIWMKRKDYNRFIEIIKKELDSTFCICHFFSISLKLYSIVIKFLFIVIYTVISNSRYKFT